MDLEGTSSTNAEKEKFIKLAFLCRLLQKLVTKSVEVQLEKKGKLDRDPSGELTTASIDEVGRASDRMVEKYVTKKLNYAQDNQKKKEKRASQLDLV